MKFSSILGESPYGLKPSDIIYPSYFKDLNLDQILEKILEKWKDYPLEKYFYYPAKTKKEILFRREVFKELKDKTLAKIMTDFSLAINQSRKYLAYREDLLVTMEHGNMKKSMLSISAKTASEIKYQHFLFDGAKLYTNAVTALLKALEKHNCKSEGLHSFFDFLKKYCSGEQFLSLCHDVQETQEALNRLTFRMELSGTKLTLHNDYEDFDARKEMIQRCQNTVSSEIPSMKSPFTNILELEDFEGLLLSMLHKGHIDVFRKLEEFSKKWTEFYEHILLQFAEEIQVYLAAQDFFNDMDRYGFSFTFPDISSGTDIDVFSNSSESSKASEETGTLPPFLLNGNYDLALACKYCFSPEKVIMNDSYLFSGEHFFVITGPNQGGKTTFARAVGQAIYCHQMGFPVAGTRSVLPVFSTLFTHFLVDEDVEAGVGKLKEELTRLQPMIQSEIQNGFVILNELFTTATTYDAEIMGKQVLNAFMEKGFLGIYVTHIQELSRNQKGIVSVTALVDKDEKTRTYHLVRAEAKGLAYAQTIAGKYRLSYEEILKRTRQNHS